MWLAKRKHALPLSASNAGGLLAHSNLGKFFSGAQRRAARRWLLRLLEPRGWEQGVLPWLACVADVPWASPPAVT